MSAAVRHIYMSLGFKSLITPNPVLAIKCGLFHSATSLLLYCCIILGVCCTLTACHSSALVGTSWLISVGIFRFFPEDGTTWPKNVGSCVHCGGCSCRCDYATRTGGRSDSTCLAGCYVTLCVRDSSYRRRKVRAALQNANVVCVRAFDIIRTVVLKTKIDRFATGPFCETWSRRAVPKLCWDRQ